MVSVASYSATSPWNERGRGTNGRYVGAESEEEETS
jgi:hypothetical protein